MGKRVGLFTSLVVFYPALFTFTFIAPHKNKVEKKQTGELN